MTPEAVTAIGKRAEAMLDALALISADPGRLTRLYLTEEHRRAARLEWMRSAGLKVRMDAAGTVHGLLPAAGDGPLAGKRLLVGSHIDTVVDAGRYDGTFGVVAGILAVEELRRRSVALPFGLEVLAFGDEEGVRFPKTLIGSSVVAGALRDPMLDLTDAEGVTIRAALAAFGGDPDALDAEAYRPEDTLGYVEAHIEQGPVLERLGLPLGVVTSIAGQARFRIIVKGEAGHAGTVPMAIRRDALTAAAEMILAIEAIGMIFDIGHGGGSCGFATSRAMLEAGFKPDVISSDVHILSIDGPAFDLLQTLAKFHVLGMSLPEVVASATVNAARAIRRPELGTLKPGALGEASIFEVLDQPTEYRDVIGEVMQSNIAFKAHGLVLDGRWWT